MSNATIDPHVFRDPSWWHWAATLSLLVVSLAGYSGGIAAAIILCGIMAGYFFMRLRQLRPFPVQVRIAYLGLLAVGMLPWMQWLHWVQLVGTTTMVTVGYCPLLRLLSLAPLNRTEPLTYSLMRRVLVQEPCRGGLVRWSNKSASPTTGGCSLSTSGTLKACSAVNPTSGKI
jgi:hypothetical protein